MSVFTSAESDARTRKGAQKFGCINNIQSDPLLADGFDTKRLQTLIAISNFNQFRS
eukprot:m.58354 g.58354  ORF g.58354 m.58354 type:complete len:56 (-) comp22533_c0_seq1:37-204(-)